MARVPEFSPFWCRLNCGQTRSQIYWTGRHLHPISTACICARLAPKLLGEYQFESGLGIIVILNVAVELTQSGSHHQE